MIINKRKIQILRMFIREFKEFSWNGLCRVNRYFYDCKRISNDEYIWMKELIKIYKPTSVSAEGYYWKIGVARPRIEWLKKTN